MGKIPYLSAGFLASVTLLVNLIMQNNSLGFSLFRAAFVMLGVLFIFFSAGSVSYTHLTLTTSDLV